MNDFLLIALNDLPSGKTFLGGVVGRKFFASFENSEILDADVAVSLCLEKGGSRIGVDIDIRGTVTVACDRCLGELRLPVDETVLLEVRFGECPEPEECTRDGREVLYLAQSDTELDLSQTVYDYICLSLPIQRHHGDGECDPEVVRHLCIQDTRPAEDAHNSPFASLGSLLSDKL